MTIIIDTREQTPWEWDDIPTEVSTLKTGDYSIKGFENEISIERKKTIELYTVTGRDRERFVRELERLSTFDYAAIIIEGTLKEACTDGETRGSSVSPLAVVASLASWSVRFGITVWFADNRGSAQKLAQILLEKWYKHRPEWLACQREAVDQLIGCMDDAIRKDQE